MRWTSPTRQSSISTTEIKSHTSINLDQICDHLSQFTSSLCYVMFDLKFVEISQHSLLKKSFRGNPTLGWQQGLHGGILEQIEQIDEFSDFEFVKSKHFQGLSNTRSTSIDLISSAWSSLHHHCLLIHIKGRPFLNVAQYIWALSK